MRELILSVISLHVIRALEPDETGFNVVETLFNYPWLISGMADAAELVAWLAKLDLVEASAYDCHPVVGSLRPLVASLRVSSAGCFSSFRSSQVPKHMLSKGFSW